MAPRKETYSSPLSAAAPRVYVCPWQDATDLVARLRAFHHTAQSQPDKKHLSQCGLDLINGKVRAVGKLDGEGGVVLVLYCLCWNVAFGCERGPARFQGQRLSFPH
jgi:hypothetical protein